jgi:alkylated DNA repair dioxygenase AlkB
MGQLDLFGKPDLALPEGFSWREGLVTPDEEAALAAKIARLPFKAFEFRQYRGLRRVVSFGWRYDFGVERLKPAEPLPAFLEPVRAKAAAFAGMAPEALVQVLVTEYAPGAGIGWHRDKAVFGQVAGVSLLAPCTLRFRRRREDGWERAALALSPRSAYVLEGPARHDWEHSIPGVQALRYSLTFRSMREPS